MPIVRPRINENLLIKIRVAYPTETATIQTIEGVIEFAIKKALSCKDREDADKMFPKVEGKAK